MNIVRGAVADAAPTLRAQMVDKVTRLEPGLSPRVAAALDAVPRHLFTGQTESAYEPGPEVRLQAVLLDQASLTPGMNVLIVEAPGGYGAALASELVGPAGEVTALYDHADRRGSCRLEAARARRCLQVAGYPGIRVVEAKSICGGVPDGAPYDAIIASRPVWDIPPEWRRQSARTGRLVLPLSLRGEVRAIAFDWAHHDLVSRTYRSPEIPGEVPRFSGDPGDLPPGMGMALEAPDGILAFLDDYPGVLRSADVDQALEALPDHTWTDVCCEEDMWNELRLYLLTSTLETVLLRWIRKPAGSVPALVGDQSVAWLTWQPSEHDRGIRNCGVVARGPQAADLADRYTDLIRRWAKDCAFRRAARIRYVPAPGEADPSATVLRKDEGCVAVSWPSSSG